MTFQKSLLPRFSVGLLCALALGLLFAPHQIVRAQSSTDVNDTGDTIATDSKCTLREAILTETGSPQADCGAGGTGVITFSVTGTITLTSEIAFTPTAALTIQGPGALSLTVDANHGSRLFDIDDTGNKGVTIQNISLINGHLTASGAQGAGILLEDGTLTLTSVTMSGNNNDSGNGGAVYNAGSLTLNASSFSTNQALRGGGIFNAGSASLLAFDSSFDGNSANRVSNAGGLGAGLYSDGTTNLFGANIFTNNEADNNGGAIFSDGILNLHAGTVIGGNGDSNSASSGGAIYEDSDGSLSIDGSTIQYNEATNGKGGGLFLSGSGNDHIDNSTFANNFNNSQVDDNRYGGAIYGEGVLALYVNNSTFIGNQVSDSGGAFYWNSNNIIRLNNSTVVENSDRTDAGGIVMADGSAEIDNTILNFNSSTSGSDPDCASTGGSFVDKIYNLISTTSCGGYLASSNAVLSDDENAVLDDILTNNGGPTLTLALLPGSPAIDAGYPDTNPIAACEETDQRGYGRNGTCDIGAFEFDGIPPGSGGSGSSQHNQSSGKDQVPVNLGGNCAALGGNSFTYNGSADVDCRLINADGVFKADAAEIGNIDVIHRGVLQAIDLFRFDNNGHSLTAFDAPVTVCLRGSGQFLFINAANTPRTVEGPASYSQGGFTCASIPNAGIAVLVPGAATPAGAPATTEAPAAGETALSNCTVTTLYRVNLHEGPSVNSAVIATIPFNVSYQATARSDGWIKLIWSDTQGWARADLLTTSGTCGG